MKKTKYFIYLIAIFVVLTFRVDAHWENFGVGSNIAVDQIYVANNNVYVLAIPEDGSYPPNLLFMSSDDGATFTDLTPNLPSSVNGLYCVEAHDGMIFLGTDNGVYASSDQGSSWVVKNDDLSGSTAYTLESDGEYIYAGVGSGVFRSNDSGENWEQLEIPLALQPFGLVTQIEKSDSLIYLNSESSAFVIFSLSRDFGEFSLSSVYTSSFLSNFSVNESGSEIFVAEFYQSGQSGLFYSSDFGSNFTPDSNFIEVNVSHVLTIGGTDFVGTFGGGERQFLYKNSSTNNVWTSDTDEIYSNRVDFIASNETYLFVSHADSTISRKELSHYGITTDVKEIDEVPTDFALEQNYPNPFNPATTIKFSLPMQSDVSLKVYDVLGKEVAELVNAEKSAGSYEVDFNAENLSSGIYFYTLRTNNSVLTKKMMLIK